MRELEHGDQILYPGIQSADHSSSRFLLSNGLYFLWDGDNDGIDIAGELSYFFADFLASLGKGQTI